MPLEKVEGAVPQLPLEKVERAVPPLLPTKVEEAAPPLKVEPEAPPFSPLKMEPIATLVAAPVVPRSFVATALPEVKVVPTMGESDWKEDEKERGNGS